MSIRISHSTTSPRFAGLISILSLGLMLAGCGTKTLPRSASEAAPPQVKDLECLVRPAGVELAWTLPEAIASHLRDSGYSFSVQRSELKWENRDCATCPTPLRAEIQRIDPAYPQPASIEGARMVWVDGTTSASHAYRYQIAVKDDKGRTISMSNPANAKVVPTPEAPRSLAAVPGPQGILLQWKESGKDEKGKPLAGEPEFLVERLSPREAWQRLTKIPVKGATYLDAGVGPDQIYDYRVTPLINFEGVSILGEPAVIQNIKAPEALPPPPPKTVWIIPTKGGLEVHWTESTGKVGGYHVYRREGKEITRLTVSPMERPPFLDRTMKKGTVYFYAVSTVSLTPDHKEGLLSKWAEIRGLNFEQ